MLGGGVKEKRREESRKKEENNSNRGRLTIAIDLRLGKGREAKTQPVLRVGGKKEELAKREKPRKTERCTRGS